MSEVFPIETEQFLTQSTPDFLRFAALSIADIVSIPDIGEFLSAEVTSLELPTTGAVEVLISPKPEDDPRGYEELLSKIQNVDEKRMVAAIAIQFSNRLQSRGIHHTLAQVFSKVISTWIQSRKET